MAAVKWAESRGRLGGRYDFVRRAGIVHLRWLDEEPVQTSQATTEHAQPFGGGLAPTPSSTAAIDGAKRRTIDSTCPAADNRFCASPTEWLSAPRLLGNSQDTGPAIPRGREVVSESTCTVEAAGGASDDARPLNAAQGQRNPPGADKAWAGHAFGVGLLTLVTVAVFSYTVHIRRPWFGTVSDVDWSLQQLTASTLKWSRIWYREGALHLRFALLENPESIEFPTLAGREPYVSYPPGSTLPIYAISRVTGQEPNPAMIMGYNLASHFSIAWLLSLVAYVALIRSGISALSAVLFAAIPPVVALLCPGPLYFLQNVYAMDTGVLLPFAVCLLLEVLPRSALPRRLLPGAAAVQWVAFLLGYLTDWLFVFVGLTFYAVRLFRSKIPTRSARAFLASSFAFWSPAAVAAALFLGQLHYVGGFSAFFQRGASRAGLGANMRESFADCVTIIVREHMDWSYGALAAPLLVGSATMLLGLAFWSFAPGTPGHVRDRLGPVFALSANVTLPCLLQMLVLWQHSAQHAFSVLKLSFALALIPFVLVPAAAVLVVTKRRAGGGAKPRSRAVRAVPALVASVSLVASLGFALHAHGQYRRVFPRPSPHLAAMERFFERAEIGRDDLLVSPDFEIRALPAFLSSHTLKRVWKCSEEGDLARVCGPLVPPFRMVSLAVCDGALRATGWCVADRSDLGAVLPQVAQSFRRRDGMPGGAFLAEERSAAVLTFVGRELLAGGRSAEAADLLRGAVSTDSELAEAHFYLGNALRSTRPDLAARCYESAIQEDPFFSEAHNNAAVLLSKTRPRAAEERLRVAVRLLPYNAAACCSLANLLAQQERYDEAVALYRQAMRVCPGHEPSKRNLAMVREMMGAERGSAERSR